MYKLSTSPFSGHNTIWCIYGPCDVSVHTRCYMQVGAVMSQLLASDVSLPMHGTCAADAAFSFVQGKITNLSKN